MYLKTIQILMLILFFVHFIFDARAAHQIYTKHKSRHPKTSISTTFSSYVSTKLRTKLPSNNNKLSLLPLSFNKVTLKPKKERRKLTTEVRFNQEPFRRRQTNIMETDGTLITEERRAQKINKNVFIELDARRAYVPNKVMSETTKYDTYSKEPNNYTYNSHENLSVTSVPENSLTIIPEKDLETDSEVGIDKKILDRIQQLENELTMMKDQVQNDTKIISDLKNRVLEKDKELTEFSVKNEFVIEDRDITEIKNQETTVKADFHATTQLNVESNSKSNPTKDVATTASKTERTDNTVVYVTTVRQTDGTEKPAMYVPDIRSFKRSFVSGTKQNHNSYYKNEKHELPNNKLSTNHNGRLKTDAENYNVHNFNTFPVSDTLHKFEDDLDQYTHKDNIPIQVQSNQFTNKNDPRNIDHDSTQDIKDMEQYYDEVKRKISSERSQTKKKFAKLPSTNETEIDDLALTENPASPTDNVTEPSYEDIENQEDFGIVKPGEGPNDFKPNNKQMNYEEYGRKLEERRMEDTIDWKTFDPKTFLSQLSAEMKARETSPSMDQEMLTNIPYSGRRMLFNNNLTNLQYNPNRNDAIDNGEIIPFKEEFKPFAPAPPKRRVLVITTVVPLPTEPVIEAYDGFNISEFVKHDDTFLGYSTPTITDNIYGDTNPKTENRNLAPEAGKQGILLDSTELLIRKVIRRFNDGERKVQKPLDFEIMKQKMIREGGKKREKLHHRIAQRMAQIKSGRRNMNPGESGTEDYNSKNLELDPFLNDSFI